MALTYGKVHESAFRRIGNHSNRLPQIQCAKRPETGHRSHNDSNPRQFPPYGRSFLGYFQRKHERPSTRNLVSRFWK